ncbi:MAG: hypothetical protein M1826_000960 [Phylliscum demangeonii]|nr:MAG: hypothetical protein M1826_000960 [Phylliscum demangeonii]
MSSLRRLAALAFAATLLLCPRALAHSERRPPLGYLSLIEEPDILTPSHRVHALSHFDLTFSLHRKRQRIKLRLEPNHEIIPDGATVQYLDARGEVVRVEAIDRRDHKVFRGQAWLQEADGQWDRVGWARIVMRRDGVRPLFEGAFTLAHDDHHVQMRSNYMRTKHALDPAVEDSEGEDEDMVVFRDSDLTGHGTEGHRELRRSLASDDDASCQAHQLSFNARWSGGEQRSAGLLTRDRGVWGTAPRHAWLGKRQLDNPPSSGGNSAGVNLRSSIGQTVGCPNTRKVALVGVATDCSYTASFNSSDAARSNIITQLNSASNVYEAAFNITLGLRNLTISEATCPGGAGPPAVPWNLPCGNNVTIQDRLNIFSAWRGTLNDSNSHWTLLTTCNTGSAVGLAWLGQVCVSRAQSSQGSAGEKETVSGANVVARTATEWQVIAHETGHIFGAVHDCTSQTCGDGSTVNAQQCCPLSGGACDAGQKYLMNPATGQGISAFSACSIGNICSAIGRNSVKTDCLSVNKGVTTITGNQCGNGIVEAGEDCDCGGDESCAANRCCDGKTCKFKGGAVCDDANEDCCQRCQYAAASQVCRPSTGECDPAETCSGTGPNCPPDQGKPDGSRCGNSTSTSSGLVCSSGHCTSRDRQCQTLMGSFTQGNNTYACDASNCQLSCASPEFGPGVCYGMQQNFLDGTTCGAGGKCQNGICNGSSPVAEIGSWISRHKPLVIGIGAALGCLLLISVLCCLYGCFRRRRAAAAGRGPGRGPTGRHRPSNKTTQRSAPPPVMMMTSHPPPPRFSPASSTSTSSTPPPPQTMGTLPVLPPLPPRPYPTSRRLPLSLPLQLQQQAPRSAAPRYA